MPACISMRKPLCINKLGSVTVSEEADNMSRIGTIYESKQSQVVPQASAASALSVRKRWRDDPAFLWSRFLCLQLAAQLRCSFFFCRDVESLSAKLPDSFHRPSLDSCRLRGAAPGLELQRGAGIQRRNDFRGARRLVSKNLEHRTINEYAQAEVSFALIQGKRETSVFHFEFRGTQFDGHWPGISGSALKGQHQAFGSLQINIRADFKRVRLRQAQRPAPRFQAEISPRDRFAAQFG